MPSGRAAACRPLPLGTDNQGRDAAVGDPPRHAAVADHQRPSIAPAIANSASRNRAPGRPRRRFRRPGPDADCRHPVCFPAILIALTIDGLARAFLSARRHERPRSWSPVLAIGLSPGGSSRAPVRRSTLVELNKDYVSAVCWIHRHPLAIALLHVLPNTLGPVLVLATVNFALAIVTEATSSFLGVGPPPSRPSLGTLIHVGNEYLFSGQCGYVLPGPRAGPAVVSVNIVGDWLSDVFNPTEPMSLRVKNLTVEIPARSGILRPVSDVSFEIQPGECSGWSANRAPASR